MPVDGIDRDQITHARKHLTKIICRKMQGYIAK